MPIILEISKTRDLSMEDVNKANEYLVLGVEMAAGYAPNLILAVATLVIGLWFISKFCRGGRGWL